MAMSTHRAPSCSPPRSAPTGRRKYADQVRESTCLALGVVLFASVTTATAQVYKCVDTQGKATYQQQPCDAKSASQSTLSTPAPAPRAPDARTAPAEPRRPVGTGTLVTPATISDRDLAILLMAKLSCDEGLPGFTERVKDDYASFRRTYREQIERVEGNASFQQSLKQQKLKDALDPKRRASQPEPDPEGMKYVQALCYGTVHGAMGGPRY